MAPAPCGLNVRPVVAAQLSAEIPLGRALESTTSSGTLNSYHKSLEHFSSHIEPADRYNLHVTSGGKSSVIPRYIVSSYAHVHALGLACVAKLHQNDPSCHRCNSHTGSIGDGYSQRGNGGYIEIQTGPSIRISPTGTTKQPLIGALANPHIQFTRPIYTPDFHISFLNLIYPRHITYQFIKKGIRLWGRYINLGIGMEYADRYVIQLCKVGVLVRCTSFGVILYTAVPSVYCSTNICLLSLCLSSSATTTEQDTYTWPFRSLHQLQ